MLLPTLSRLPQRVFRQLPLRTVLIVPFVLQIVGTVGLVGYLSYRNGQEAVHDVVDQLCSEISDRTVERINTYLKTPHHINLMNAEAIRLGELDFKNSQALERHFLKQIKVFDSIDKLYFSNSQGGFIAIGNDLKELAVAFTENFVSGTLRIYSIDRQGNRKKILVNQPNYDPRNRPFYQSSVKAGKPTWSPIFIYVPASRGLGIAASYPFYNRVGKLQGVLSTDLSLVGIDKFLHQLKIGTRGEAFIIERSGLIVASSATEQPFFRVTNDNDIQRLKSTESREPLIRFSTQHLLSSFGSFNQINTSQQLEFEIEGKRHFLQVTPFKDEFGLDWLIVIVVPEADFTARIQANTRNTILLCLAALVSSTIVGIVTAQWITKPIFALNKAAKRIATGEWDKAVEIDRADEVGELAKSFNQMADQLADYHRNLKAQIAEGIEAFKQSEERFKTAFDTAAVGMCLASITGQYLAGNRSFCQFFGYSEEELLSLTWQEITYPEDLEVDLNLAQELLAGKISYYHLEKRFLHKEGRIIWGLLSVSLVRDSQQNPVHFIAQIQDISDRKLLELALQQSEERFRTCVENLLDPLAIFYTIRDKSGQIVDFRFEYINPAGCRINRRSLSEMLGKGISEVIPAFRETGLFALYCRVVDTGKPLNKEFFSYEGVYAEGRMERFFDIQAVKLREGLMVTWRDVTERKQAEERIQTSLKEKEVLLREIHHRVKNNLQVIHSLLKLQSSYTDEPKILQMFQESQNRIRSMGLIHELLYQSQDLARINFGAYINTLVKQLARTYTVSSDAISWNIEIEPPDIELGIDTALPCGLILNELVCNALKYAFPEGNPGQINISLQACNNHNFVLIISDNGVGIPPELDFRNTNSLGLQLVCGTIAQIGGTIELEPTQGTTFILKFREVQYKPRR